MCVCGFQAHLYAKELEHKTTVYHFKLINIGKCIHFCLKGIFRLIYQKEIPEKHLEITKDPTGRAPPSLECKSFPGLLSIKWQD